MGETATCTIAMNTDTTVQAVFVLVKSKTARLTVTKVKKSLGDGTVLSSDGTINCGKDCAETFYLNAPVALTATPNPNSVFAGWTNCPSPADATCFVTMDKAYTVKAAFTGPSIISVVKVSKNKGKGTVTSDPAGITCGTDCKESFKYGTTVTLAAAPDAGSVFSGWSGPCTGTGTCVVAVSKATTVRATFEVPKTTAGPATIEVEGEEVDETAAPSPDDSP